ncbi:MAG: TlpA family protein disulfide reductase [Rubrivivax sp.]|nr:TlpA family protein disulfide reductase [Rubrivivax sp.]
MKRRQQLVLALAGAAAAAAGLSWALWRPTAETGPSDDFWALRFPRPEGGELAMADYRHQVLVLNFWATWCPPCIKELPDLDRLQRQNKGRLQVVGLAVDGQAPVRQFLERQPLSFAIGLAGFEGTELSRRLGNDKAALPFTVVFDRHGQPRHRKLGQTVFDELQRWVAEL